MKKLTDSVLEIKVLKTLLIRKDFENFEQTKELFGTDEAKEIANRISTLLQYNNPPTMEGMQRDLAITQASRDLLHFPEQLEDLESAVEDLQRFATARLSYATIQAAVTELQKDNPSFDLVDRLFEGYVAKRRSESKGWDSTKISLTEGTEWVDEAFKPLDDSEFFRTGFRDFDSTWTLKTGHLLVISAPSGSGKSILMQVLASNFYKYNEADVAEVSFEMTLEELNERRLSHISKIEYKKISSSQLTDQEKDHIKTCLLRSQKQKRLESFSTYLDVGINELGIKLRDFNVVLIDYLGLLKTDDKKSQQEAYGEIARQAKMMAKKNNQLVVLLTQLDDKEHTIKYSKAIKANCDFLWAFWLDEQSFQSQTVMINQQKVRHGEMKDFTLRHDLNRIWFGDLDCSPPMEKKPEPKGSMQWKP